MDEIDVKADFFTLDYKEKKNYRKGSMKYKVTADQSLRSSVSYWSFVKRLRKVKKAVETEDEESSLCLITRRGSAEMSHRRSAICENLEKDILSGYGKEYLQESRKQLVIGYRIAQFFFF